MTTVITAIVSVFGAVLGSGIIQYLITRRDNKTDKLSAIEKKLERQERDACRTQLLLMMHCYKEEVSEIMTIAEHYFAELKGDWYVSTIFAKWMKESKVDIPAWYRKDK